MSKTGTWISRLVPFLAKMLGIEAPKLLRLYLSTYLPDALEFVDLLLMTDVLTPYESELIQSYRHLCQGNEARPILMDGKNIVALVTV